ncbi:LinC-like SDR-family protein [Sphingobium sp. SYK-6]|uniref:SDR family NAD(P)-dependent oxidoreductase n=1 Tax=Sphingobium sp. (strain NBRC 103272 / SYK-6) TaxID=627192 RepID=UPI00022775DD|nr:SDR family oxidoreductase [Sphingobium sp. SYK-6]BAK66679.1 LinC-like SDR-family protein [Sphingobium sp. SYK-6]
MPSHKDRVIIVTGAAGAIGYATAGILAAQGARVVMVDIAASLEERAAELAKIGEVDFIRADCASETDVRAYVDQTVAKHGRIDGFFNNAGVEGVITPIHEYPIDEYDRILAVNLRGVFLGLRFVLVQMVAQGSGAVVNTASIGSERGLAGGAAYNAAKHGVVGLTRTAAADLGPKGIRVNCVEPGVIETPLLNEVLVQMFDGDLQKGLDTLGWVSVMNRCGKPAEVGHVVSFLLSDEASFVTGAAWPVDGGALCTIKH